jgi:hypothetical protein
MNEIFTYPFDAAEIMKRQKRFKRDTDPDPGQGCSDPGYDP